MNGKKIKTKAIVLLICFFFLTSISGVSLAATMTDTNTGEKPLEIFEIEELNHAPTRSEYAPDEILVKFKSDIEDGALVKANSEYGTSVKSTLLSGTKVLRVPSDKTVDEMVKIYESLPEVEYAEPNYIVHAFMVPNDTYYSLQWHLDNHVYGGINMESAWSISTGSGVVVAVIDTGVAYEDYSIYYQAPDLAGTTFVQGYDYVNDDTHPNDDNGHGTHVAGTIAQTTNNGYGVAGVAFGCSIMPIKVLNETGSGSNAWVADGIYYAVDNGADVISMSLGGSSPSSTIEDAVEYAYNHGVTVIAAAGNEYLEGNPTEYPAAYDDYVIAVGATRYDETRSYYSNTGSYLDVVAPGGDTSVDQNGDGYADGVLQQTFVGDPSSFDFYFKQGTSMATPHVSGVAALLIANGVTGPDNIRSRLQSTAEDKGTSGWDEEYGWGLVDASAALLGVVSINISEAVDNYDLNWTTGGNANWSGQNDTYYYGGDAAESGDIGNSQSSWLQTNVTGPGTLSFYWKVSSEEDYDFLKFDIDDVEQHAISGTTSWAQKTYSISSGTHTLKWEYSKDYSYYEGEDCGWVDKVEYVINETEGSPDIGVDPTSFNVTLSTNTTQSYTLTIENQGTATLTYNISDANATASVSSQDKTSKRSIAIIPELRTSENENNNNNEGAPTVSEITASDVLKQSGTTQVLAWVLYTDYDQEYNNTLSAISQYYTDYAVTESTTTDSGVLSSELAGKDVFLVPEPETANSTTLATMGSTFSTVLLDFVNNGGTVIVCCEWSGYQGFLLNAGLMNATFANGYWTGNFTVADSTHPITDGLGSTVTAADAVASYSITDPEIQNLIVDASGYPVVAVRDLGSGHVVLIGYDYYSYNDDAARIISNAVKFENVSTDCTWLTETPTSGSITSGNYDNITVSINTTGLSAGSYSANISISSNDPDESTTVVPVNLTVSTTEEVGTGGLETIDLNSGPTPTTLANTLMGGGVTVSNVTYSGVNISAGTFSNGTDIIGFYSGIILSSGNISNVIGPNTYDGTSKDNGMLGDADLDTLIPGYDTYDASVLEFDFVPDTDVVTFEYVFGSEEYNEYVHSEFNDVFGFFINGVNHALIPGTSTPVSINNVNGGNPYGTNANNSAYYRNNDLDDGGGSINTELDGLTIVLSVTASVNAGEINHIKLAIADAGDYILDSDVFIKAESFIAPNLTLSPVTATNPVDINHTLTATLIENGSGASGRTITFNITDGPNAGLTGTNTTNSNGQATWSYASSVNGTDAIVATSASETSNTAYVTWQSFIEAFDTGTGMSPSISGTHNGTIVMSSHVNVSYMYTYPCAGTGGHAESVKIWNSTWNTTATWSGYSGDYHNITFDESFILRAGQTYNYMIITGSYPQIIHATSKAVTGGTITCTEFTDVNGVTYDDRIPAIMLR